MMRTIRNLVALILTIAVATAIAGWWAVPLVSGMWTLAAPRRAAVIYAAFAGAAAWAALLIWAARAGPIGGVDALLTPIMNLPPRALIGLTLLYAALLAGAAALLAQAIRPPTFKSATVSSRSR